MFIPYGKQNINQADVDAVVQVLQSDFLTQGPQVPLFEKSVAELVGAKYAFAMNSATSALHVACLALGLKKEMSFGHLLLPLLHQPIVHCTVKQMLISLILTQILIIFRLML